MSKQIIFHDESLKRWKVLKRIGMAAALIGVIVSTVFVVSLLVIPVLDPVAGIGGRPKKFPRIFPVRQTSLHSANLKKFLLKRVDSKFRAALKEEKKLSASKSAPAEKGKIVAAFYATWQESGIHSLRAHADKLTHLMPEWLHLSADGAGLELFDWAPVPHNSDVIAICRQSRVRIMPILNNASGSVFDEKRIHLLLTHPKKQKILIEQLKQWLVQNQFQGINIDFENLSDEDSGLLQGFLKRLSSALHPAGLEVSADIEAEGAANWKDIARESDFVVIMAYDENYSGSDAGPLASISWYTDILKKSLAQVPPEKLVIGIGNYGYDWTEGKPPAQSLTFQEALQLARDNRPDDKPEDIVDFDPQALNPTFNYEDDNEKLHEVWFLDGVTAANEWKLAQQAHIRGAAVWALGMEDPSVWNSINVETIMKPVEGAALENIEFPYDVEFVGEGDILKVKTMPQPGQRALETDPASGLFTDESYHNFPSAFLLQRNGLVPKMVALTFDDGPWEPYTAQILDVLKSYNVKATFFVIGENLERHPDIVERMWNEGHEIGNHSFTHPNIGAVTEQRAKLELNSTERALQSVIGRSTILFRPPYNADAEPTSAEEVWPVVFASKMGYITVGEFIDPQDWNIEGDGAKRRTALDIAEDIMEKVRTGHGNTILLHDGGGDRSATVAALPILIPQLRKEGYTFVKVSGLLHSTTDKMMPLVDKNSNNLLFADRIVFELNYVFKIFLEFTFISAIALGTLRAVFITVLALIARRKEKSLCDNPGYHPSVSVIIAAYNEGKVIGQTIESVLANSYVPVEIIVVDDGSKDNTSSEVERCAKKDARVILIRQENQGKARALNKGIEISKSEILICLDADTSFNKDTIGNLVCKFNDPIVGAVAGNVKVGNRVNILTYWQAIEYITSQNIERRAYGLLNAVTVVPGAVGAWRKEAVLQAGGYSNDTLAEDMDLTWRLRKAGWRIETAINALGFTETPDTVHTLFKQRFRWTFGTLQCLWKHRGTLGRYKAFGRVMLPSLWLFQILYQIISPLIDLQIAWVLFSVIQSWLSRGVFHQDWQPLSQAVTNFYYIGFMYAFFFVIELTGSSIAFSIEREKKGILWWLFWQRLVYRQIMYAVVIKSVQTALSGIRTGWSKAERKGTVGSQNSVI